MCEDAVEGDASFFVGIETLIEEIAEEASVLRDAFAVDARRGSDGIGRVLGVGGEVADSSESAAGNDGIGDDVNIFVDLARLKAAVEVDMAGARDEFSIDGVRKLPLRAGNNRALGPARIAHREDVAMDPLGPQPHIRRHRCCP